MPRGPCVRPSTPAIAPVARPDARRQPASPAYLPRRLLDPLPDLLLVAGKSAAASPAAPAEPATERCGHRSMNGRSCTRDAGHSETSHRYS